MVMKEKPTKYKAIVLQNPRDGSVSAFKIVSGFSKYNMTLISQMRNTTSGN